MADIHAESQKTKDVRKSNILAAKGMTWPKRELEFSSFLAVADAVRTSLGPRGMDKMVLNTSTQHKLIFTDCESER